MFVLLSIWDGETRVRATSDRIDAIEFRLRGKVQDAGVADVR